MEVDPALVMRMAALARLTLRPPEAERLAVELNGILAHVEALRAADVADAEALGAVAAEVDARRADLPGDDALRAPLALFAPEADAGFFTVPRLAALDGEGE